MLPCSRECTSFSGAGVGVNSRHGWLGVVGAGGGEVAVVVDPLPWAHVGLPLVGEGLYRGHGRFANGGVGFKGDGLWTVAPPQAANDCHHERGNADGANHNRQDFCPLGGLAAGTTTSLLNHRTVKWVFGKRRATLRTG